MDAATLKQPVDGEVTSMLPMLLLACVVWCVACGVSVLLLRFLQQLQQ